VTWVTLDTPLVQLGGLTASLLNSQTNPKVWRAIAEPAQKLYPWLMNNHWGTNYRAYQEGPVTFRFALGPHTAYDPAAATRLATGLSQPLLALPTAPAAPSGRARLTLTNERVVATAFKPSDDGKGWILRLYNVSDTEQQVGVEWGEPKPTPGASSRDRANPGMSTRPRSLACEYRHDLVRFVSVRNQRAQSAVERHEASLVADGEAHQMRVSDLLVTDDARERDPARLGKPDIVSPEVMMRQGRDAAQQRRGLLRGHRSRNGSGIGGDADESQFDQGRGGPSVPGMSGEPAVSPGVMHMIGPRQRHDHVDVEQGHHQVSSSASRTISGVSGRASGGTLNTGNPLDDVAGRAGLRARRASRERILPTLLRSIAARLFTASYTSSSRWRVVRMTRVWHLSIMMSRCT
jgi:hypothetical protein